MDVLILGGNGLLGPYVVDALGHDHNLRITDVNDAPCTPHEYINVDVSDIDQVSKAAEGMDAIINLSVMRPHRKLAFDVNARGCYNMMSAAVRHGIRRVINTGPPFSYGYRSSMYHDLAPDLPSQSGTALYTCTKSLGHEICRIYTEHHEIYVMTMMFGSFRDPDDPEEYGKGVSPFIQTYPDAANVFPLALTVDLRTLPSRCEMFNVCSDIPGRKYTNQKTKRLLGWNPKDSFVKRWDRSIRHV